MQDDLSQAILSFLGFGSAASPLADHSRLIQEFGVVRGTELYVELSSILQELGKIEVDWSEHSLVSAGEMAREIMRARHPVLPDEATRALAWKFAFDWRSF
jgi:hypothetical protein